jgi:hypothetical protein
MSMIGGLVFVAFCAAAVSVGVSLVEEHHGTEVLHVQE